MLDIISRHRPLSLLAGVLFAQILLLAFQIKREHDVRLIRYWAAEIVTPGERAATWILSRAGGVWNGYIALHRARAENDRLRGELDQMRLRNAELETQAEEAQRLRALLGLRESYSEVPMLAAQVIGASADPSSHVVFVNRGERDHVRRNMAVITPDGIVGKIVEVLANNSQVLLLNDKESGVGALLAGTRTHGVVKGTGDFVPRLEYIVNDEKIRPGDLILTSGDDRIFPKGLLIGTVSDAAPGSPFQVIHVRLGARLDRLEDVIILLSQQELVPKQTEASTGAAEAPAVASGVAQAAVSAPNAPPPSNAATSASASGAPKPPASAPASSTPARSTSASQARAPATAPAAPPASAPPAPHQ